MKKAQEPTSQFQVFCDTFDMKAEAKIHTSDDGQKLKITLTSEDGKTEQSISLFKEDAEMFSLFLANLTPFLQNRNIRKSSEVNIGIWPGNSFKTGPR